MTKKIRITESELVNIIKKIISEDDGFEHIDDIPFDDAIEDEVPFDDDDFEEIDSDEYGFDISHEDTDYPDDFQRKMNLKDFMKRNKPSSVGFDSHRRWDTGDDNPKPWSPIKPSDMPLDKYLNSLKTEKKKLSEGDNGIIEKILNYITSLSDPSTGFNFSSLFNSKSGKSNNSNIDFGKMSDKDFYSKLLQQLGAPVTNENLKFLYAWRQSEGNSGKYNPFNTTQNMPGATNFNSVGVKNYETLEDGFNATLKTLKNGRYDCIINGLKNDIGADKISTKCIRDLKTWGTGDLVAKVISGYDSGSTPKPSSLTS